MKFEHTEAWGFEHALRGMRNPLASWDKSDSAYDENGKYIIGPNDMALARKLIAAGSEHRKFLRQIMVSVDITAPLYWFSEFDTYKIGTTANSTSTMHKLAHMPITALHFELDDYHDLRLDSSPDVPFTVSSFVTEMVTSLEKMRLMFLSTGDKRYWKELVRWLPRGWLQTRTVTMNYENLLNMYHQRKNHKLTEWSESFCGWVKTLPYAKDLITGGD